MFLPPRRYAFAQGDGYTLPFLSGVESAEGELPTSEIEALSGSQGTRTPKTPEDSEALGCDVESGRALSPNSAAHVAPSKVPASPVGDGRASSPAFASVKDFSCSGEEDESPTHCRSTTSLRENTETKTCREKGDMKEPVRGFCLYDHDNFDDVSGDTEKKPLTWQYLIVFQVFAIATGAKEGESTRFWITPAPIMEHGLSQISAFHLKRMKIVLTSIYLSQIYRR